VRDHFSGEKRIRYVEHLERARHQPRGAPPDTLDTAEVAVEVYPVARLEGLLELQREPAENVAERFLKRQADDRGDERRGGEKRRDVDVELQTSHEEEHDRVDEKRGEIAKDRREVGPPTARDQIRHDDQRAHEPEEKSEKRDRAQGH